MDANGKKWDIHKTPSPIKGDSVNMTPERNTENMEYCEDLLRSVDMCDSENEEIEDELGVLPSEAVQILQSETWRRSLLESLTQAEEGAGHENKTRWGTVVTKRPATRGHGNVNIIEKAAAYKRKKNLEIPTTFKGAKMAKYTMCFGPVGGNDQEVENTMIRISGCATSPMFKATGPPKRGIA
ncbi:uncharacterized protein [Triticum aestivum]|uniref:uncharacterized protein n=1 Tax=Triticum aestivum TaxID=4565 RepID=UPI001D02F8BC|nr:uncharacterized protein LOC123089500 [Triticum aestivum]